VHSCWSIILFVWGVFVLNSNVFEFKWFRLNRLSKGERKGEGIKPGSPAHSPFLPWAPFPLPPSLPRPSTLSPSPLPRMGHVGPLFSPPAHRPAQPIGRALPSFPFSRCRPGPACRHPSPLPLFSPVLNDLRNRRRASPLGPHAEASTPVLKWPRSLHPPVPTCALTLVATEGLQCRRLFLFRSGHLGLPWSGCSAAPQATATPARDPPRRLGFLQAGNWAGNVCCDGNQTEHTRR
jgi:hypothetical protein